MYTLTRGGIYFSQSSAFVIQCNHCGDESITNGSIIALERAHKLHDQISLYKMYFDSVYNWFPYWLKVKKL